MDDRIEEAVRFLGDRIGGGTEICMITGTGLGSLTESMEVHERIPYGHIPNFPRSTVQGHKGTLAVGSIGGRKVCALEGRFHLYEGNSPQQAVFPIRVMRRLGAGYLLVSSAAGGLDPLFSPGDIMAVTDHINMTGKNPLAGPNLDKFGPRFPEMSRAYDPELLRLACDTALELRIRLHKGVYVGVLGPSLETPAETRFLKMIGADAVGMSTVHETITAVHCGFRVLAIVAITNVNLPDCMEAASLDSVIANARKASSSLSLLWRNIIEKLPVQAQ